MSDEEYNCKRISAYQTRTMRNQYHL